MRRIRVRGTGIPAVSAMRAMTSISSITVKPERRIGTIVAEARNSASDRTDDGVNRDDNRKRDGTDEAADEEQKHRLQNNRQFLSGLICFLFIDVRNFKHDIRKGTGLLPRHDE